MCVGGGIEHDSARLGCRLLDPVDQQPLVVGLPEVDPKPERTRRLAAQCLHVGQGLAAVDARLAGPEEIQVRAVQHEHGGSLCHERNLH